MKTWVNYWNDTSIPEVHSKIGDNYYNIYANEVKQLLGHKNKIVDTGCGDCEITLRVADSQSEIIGIDFSEEMIQRAKVKIQGNHKISLYCDDMLNLDQYVKGKVDGIFNYSVIQYLSLHQINVFLQKCYSLLNEDGVVLIMDVPDSSRKDLQAINFFREEKKVTSFTLIYKIIKLKLYLLKMKLLKPNFKYDLDIGNWFSKADFKQLANNNGYDVEFFNPLIINYGYRFHAKFYKKKK